MRIPKSVTILGRKFVVMSKLTDAQMRLEMGLLPDQSTPMGAMNYSKRKILVRDHENKEEEIVTYVHECLHAMQYIVGLSQVTDCSMAEIWCESGANAMVDVFRGLRK